jgi:hypothetical protein
MKNGISGISARVDSGPAAGFRIFWMSPLLFPRRTPDTPSLHNDCVHRARDAHRQLLASSMRAIRRNNRSAAVCLS